MQINKRIENQTQIGFPGNDAKFYHCRFTSKL